MTQEGKELVTKINKLTDDIRLYIGLNEDWIYYFLNPLSGGNEEIFDCLKEHPEDWEDYIDFEVSIISGASVQIKIRIDDNTDCGIVLGRYINLLNFEETVVRNKKLYNGEIKEIRKKNIKEDIKRLKELLLRKEKELKAL